MKTVPEHSPFSNASDEDTSRTASPLLHSESNLSSLEIKNFHLRADIIGLRNRSGNDCFINAGIQCLASTPLFIQWILSGVHTTDVCKYPDTCTSSCDEQR